MRSLLLFSFFISFLLPVASFAAAPYDLDLGRYNALIISNQDYKQLPDLKTPHGDADALADLLRSDYGFRITMLKDTNRAGTLDALDQLVEKLTPNDNLLIFYAGHGHLDSATGEGYWLPVSASPRRRSEWISNSDISDTLRATVAKHVLVISDSCFSGTLSRSVAAGLNVGREEDKRQYFSKLAKRKSRTALSSGGLEPVDDGGGSGHSVFAGALISALRRNNEPILEAETLYTQIKRPVALNSSAIQKPQYSDVRATGHDEGDFLFAKRNIRKVTKPVIASASSSASSSGVDTQAAYELTFWNSIKDSQDGRAFSAYIEAYPQGKFVSLARLKTNSRLKPEIQSSPEDVEQSRLVVPAKSEPAIQLQPIVVEEPQLIARIEPVPAQNIPNAKQIDNVLVVLATPDSEYSPKFSTVEAYSKAVANLVTSALRGESLLYLAEKKIAQDIINEDENHTTSKQLCLQYSAKAVISIELDLSRDIDELTRTPDDAYWGFYDCKNNSYNITNYSLDFQLGEEFAYAAGIQDNLSQFNKAYLAPNK